MDLSHHRNDYQLQRLTEDSVSQNPFSQFQSWFQYALSKEIFEANAMVLSTAHNGKPSSRVVLLKEFTDSEFVFFTNYNSKKGKSIEENPYVSILFFWKELEQQVRIEGIATKISSEKSDQYFQSRPIESQKGAIASPQSQVIPNRYYLEERLNQIQEDVLVRPESWGGYAVVPSYFEFWQGGSMRLHDRIAYTLENNQWKIERLAP